MKSLYPIAPLIDSGKLRLGELHQMYFEVRGNQSGIPVVHLHGGPGGKSSPKYSQFYDPEKYKIILFDQRGCGKSTPLGETRENTTQDLISDMEALRSHLGIDKWVVSGGSWGSTLALAYSESHSDRVLTLIVRAVITYRKFELDWAVEGGASNFFPEAWESYKNFIPKEEQDNLTKAYAKRVFGENIEERNKAVIEANNWALAIANLEPELPDYQKQFDENVDVASTKIFYHYELQNGFLKNGEILENAGKLKGIPGVIIQGRYDMICPPITAWELHKYWPGSMLEIVVGGHHYNNPNLQSKLLEWTDRIAEAIYTPSALQ